MILPVTIIVPAYFNELLAVFGLLLAWKLHEIRVQAGLIHAVDFWDRSGIRMFVHVTPSDHTACPACQEANGTVFLPTLVRKTKFKALSKPCTNPSGCRCLLVGLYGGWPDAQRLVNRVRVRPRMVRLSSSELTTILSGPWERYAGSAADRIPIHLLEAMLIEGKDPEAASFRYRFVESNAKRDQDFSYVLHAFVRQSEMLERQGRLKEALDVVDRFFQVYETKRKTINLASDSNFIVMSNRKAQLKKVVL